MLEVSSPGLERPLRWHRHWVRFVGREVQATVAGLGRVRARIVAVPDEVTVVLEPQGGAPRPVPLAGIHHWYSLSWVPRHQSTAKRATRIPASVTGRAR